MALDEKLFAAFFRKLRQLQSPPKRTSALHTCVHRARLELLASSISGTRVTVRESEGDGGMGGNGVFSLPESLDRFDSPAQNEEFLVLRTAFIALALRIPLPPEALVPIFLEEFPGARTSWSRFGNDVLGTFVSVSGHILSADPSIDPSLNDSRSRSVGANATERKGKTRDAVRRIILKEPGQENPFTHSFEKTHTLEEYKGGAKKVDASDDMASHEEALDEVQMREVVRSTEQAQSVYRADILIDDDVAHVTGAPTNEARALFYDEWDAALGNYRSNFCTVRESVSRRGSPDEAIARRRTLRKNHRNVIARLSGELARHFRARIWNRGQMDGTEIDLDAMVSREAALRAGQTPPERLYESRTRQAADLHVSVLIDTSLSSDSWVLGRRVLDVAVDAVFLLAEVLDPFVVACEVAAFDSRTRRDCGYRILKSPSSSWQETRERAVGLVPDGYTRIGPALRHANTLLSHAAGGKVCRKLLLVLSDAKPSDFDRYEGRYGVADVRQAIRELRADHTTPHLFALDGATRPVLTEMFGPRGYSVVPNVNSLITAMTQALSASLR